MCCPTGCTQWPPLASHVSNYMSCYSTGLPGAAKRISMKKKHTVDLPTEKSRHGGSNAKSGCCITNANVRHWSRTLKAFCMHSGARKRMLLAEVMHTWNIAQRGGKQRWHLPAQATTTLAGCERPARARRRTSYLLHVFFCFFLLHAAKIRSSCEEGSGPYSQHIIIQNLT